MAPLPQNNTGTGFLRYTSEGVEHELVFRLDSTAATTDYQASAQAIATILSAAMHTSDSFLSLRYRAQGSNLSFPLAFTAIAGTSSVTPTAGKEPQFFSLTGRSSGGRRARMTFYCPIHANDEEYREAVTSIPAVSNWYNEVVAGVPEYVAIDGLPVVWNAYVNIGYNSYYQRKARRGL